MMEYQNRINSFVSNTNLASYRQQKLSKSRFSLTVQEGGKMGGRKDRQRELQIASLQKRETSVNTNNICKDH